MQLRNLWDGPYSFAIDVVENIGTYSMSFLAGSGITGGVYLATDDKSFLVASGIGLAAGVTAPTYTAIRKRL